MYGPFLFEILLGSLTLCLVAARSPGWFDGDPTSLARDNIKDSDHAPVYLTMPESAEISPFVHDCSVCEVFFGFAGHFEFFAGHWIEFNSSSSQDILKICQTCPASRPVQFARPTSGANQCEPRTSPFCPQQVPRTCLAISHLALGPQKSMTYLFVSTFHDKSISFLRIKVGSPIKK